MLHRYEVSRAIAEAVQVNDIFCIFIIAAAIVELVLPEFAQLEEDLAGKL